MSGSKCWRGSRFFRHSGPSAAHSAATGVGAYDEAGTGSAALEMLEEAARYNGWLASKLEPFLGSKNLELGAGHGTLTAFVAKHRDVVASEPSDLGRSVLARRFSGDPRLRAVIADVSELSPGETFDCVYSANVLEHVADDIALIEKCAQVLRPGGHFVAIVPAGPWLYSPFDASVGHYRRYGRSDRDRLSRLERAPIRLKLKSFRAFNPVGAVGWFVRMRLLQRNQIPVADVKRFDQLVPVLRQLDRLRFGFGQNLLIAFEKLS